MPLSQEPSSMKFSINMEPSPKKSQSGNVISISNLDDNKICIPSEEPAVTEDKIISLNDPNCHYRLKKQ